MKRFDFNAFDFEYSKVMKAKEYYIIFHENHLEYLHYLILQIPDEFDLDDESEELLDVESWKKETDYLEMVIKKEFITEIKHEWDKDFKIHNILILTTSGGELSVPFQKIAELKEFYTYLKEWYTK